MKIIQFVGTSEQIDKYIKINASKNILLIDMKGDKELEKLFEFYTHINPLDKNKPIKERINFISSGIRECTYYINDCHCLTKDDLESVIKLSLENKIKLCLFSNNNAIDLKLPFTRSLGLNHNGLVRLAYSFE